MAHSAHGRVLSEKKYRISLSVSCLIVALQACNKKRAGKPTLTLLDNELVVSDNNACDFIARDVVVSVFN